MPLIKCGVCGKRMPTEKVLAGHLRKAHSNLPEQPTATETKTPTETVAQTVKLVSLDAKKPLEVSIGSQYWRGLTIEVPSDLAGEIMRLLKDGGYYYKVE